MTIRFRTVFSGYLVLAVLLILAAGGQNAIAHAGHDAIPEAAVQVAGDVAPRFYSTSDIFDAVLVFPPPQKAAGEPLLYLTTKKESTPVAQAEILAEVLAPDAKKLETSTGPTSGSYIIRGLAPETTHTISLEITAASGSDFLTFDNVIVESHAGLATPLKDAKNAETWLGLPPYLIKAMVAVFAVLALANILVILFWVTGVYRRKFSAKAPGKSSNSTLPLILLITLGMLPGQRLMAHAGDDHSEAALSASATASSGSVHFVAIETQFQGGIRTTVALEQKLPKTFNALGQVVVRPDFQADVTPPAEGKLKPPPGNGGRIPISGAEVKKGDVLVVLEQLISATDKVAISGEKSQVEAELSQAVQELALATKNAGRSEELKNVIAAKEVEEARAAKNIAAEKVSGLRNRLVTLTQSLTADGDSVRDIEIRSPLTGVIIQSHVTQGEYVSPDKVLYEIVSLDEVFVQADIFESDIASVSDASTATITLEAYPGKSFQGTLHSLAQQIDPQQRTLRALFTVPNSSHLLRGGMFVSVGIQTGESLPAITISKAALFSQDGVKQVYKKLGPETFAAVPIVISRFSEDMAVVSSGISAGDRVAVSGLYQIRMSPIVSGGR